MFNETSYSLGYASGYLGPPASTFDNKSWRLPRGMPGGRPGPLREGDTPSRCAPVGQTNSIPAQPIYPPGCSFEGDMASPVPVQDVGVVHTVDGGGNAGTVAGDGGGFNIGSLLSGDIMGIPTWLVLGGAAWFFFFRKGR